jgi:glutamate dehydrogenase/leucine dehydrogenase
MSSADTSRNNLEVCMSQANPERDAAAGTPLDPRLVVGNDVDPFGPLEIVQFENAKLGARAIYVCHNISRGPAIGGCRFARDVTPREVYELARAMTFKNAAALIPHGGAKSAIVANPADFPQGSARRRELIEWYADCIAPYTEYIPGPDMSTDERDMDVIFAKTGRAIGRTGGIELDRLGLTALGVMHAFRVLVECGFVDGLDRVGGTTMAIEGFGNVGSALARFAAQDDVRLVAVSDFVNPELDYGGVVVHADGLDLARLLALREEGRSVVDTDQPGVQVFRGRAELKRVFAFPVDVVVPAARTNSVDLDTARSLRTRLVLQAANAPLTEEGEQHLHRRGVHCGVDYIVNCGGVIGGAEGWAELQSPLGSLRVPNCVARIVNAVGKNIPAIYELSRASNITPRHAAEEIVRPRIG